MEEKVYFKTTDELKLCGILTKSEQISEKCVILCHGITVDKEEDGIFTDLAKKIAKNGFNVLRFDFRGHGESEGESVDMTIHGESEDIEAALVYLRSRGFSKFAIVAASFAGGAACFFTSKNKDFVSAFVLWNSLIDYGSRINTTTPWGKKYWGKPALDRAKKYGYTEIGSRKFKVGKNLLLEMQELEPWKELLKLSIPTLFIHGDADTYVPYSDSVKYSKLVKNGTMVTIKGAEHGFHDNEQNANKADEATIAFIQKFL